MMLLPSLISIFHLSSLLRTASAKLSDESYGAASTASPLDVFQVQAPLREHYEDASCQQVIVQHDFTASYGTPFVGSYTPPNDCKFTSTIFNLSVTSTGINYDRLGLLFFGDIEIWRTTTAMPTRTGIRWDFQKDVSVFDSLLRTEQKVIMQLDNLYDSVFTGNFNVTITAMYYNDHAEMTPADKIYPLSSQSSNKNQTSVFSLPDQNATVSFALPRNMARAVVSIIASGNGAEEFWYKHVPNEYTSTFNNTAIRAYSPWREVQLLVDGNLAGVSWPFPVVFTGGISPGLWVPIVGIDTYDIPSFEIDISPWLGELCDGKTHTFGLKVVGWDSETTFGTVASNWYVTGSIFVWVDNTSTQTLGSSVVTHTTPPIFHFAPQVVESLGTNTSLRLELTASRTITHTATIFNSGSSSHPRSRIVTWEQSLFYANTQKYTAKGYNVTLSQQITGTSIFSSNSPDTAPITNKFFYPLSFSTANNIPVDPTVTNSSIYASLDRSKVSSTTPILSYLTFPTTFRTPEKLNTRQSGTCLYFWNDTYYESAGAIDPAKGTIGGTEQWYSFTGKDGYYGRYVKAVDGYEPGLLLDEPLQKTTPIPT